MTLLFYSSYNMHLSLVATTSGQFDAPVFFHLFMVILVELSTIFWVGAQLWLMFVIQRIAQTHEEQRTLYEQVQLNFERRFSVPVLIILFLARIGVLAGLPFNLDMFWLVGEVVTALALLLGVYVRLVKQRPHAVNTVLSYAKLTLSLAMLIVLTIPSYASTLSRNVYIAALLGEWVYLLAAALVVGGTMFIVAVYMPVLRHAWIIEGARPLALVLAYFSPLAVASTIIMLLIDFLEASLHNISWGQLLTTAYGRTFVLETLLLGGLLLLNIVLLSVLHPRLNKELQKYAYAHQRYQNMHVMTRLEHVTKVLAEQIKQREGRLANKVHQTRDTAQWASIVGLGVIICMSLTTVFVSTPVAPTKVPQQQTTRAVLNPFVAMVMTTDTMFSVTLTVNPNHFGPNVFTVRVVDEKTRTLSKNIRVSLSLNMLDMSMGTEIFNLQVDSTGQFSGTGNISMTGNWKIAILIRTSDAGLHQAQVKLLTT